MLLNILQNRCRKYLEENEKKTFLTQFLFLKRIYCRSCPRNFLKMIKKTVFENAFGHLHYIAVKFWFLSYGSKCSRPIKLQDLLRYNISWRKSGIQLNFYMQIIINVLWKVKLSFLVDVAGYARAYPNYIR